MRIVVCVKQVPEVSELSIDPVTRRLVRDGVPALINPFDRRAVLEALRLRDEAGEGSVTVLTMGPPQAAEALRECLSLGVDRAVHLCDRAFAGADTLATARALAAAIEMIGSDLVLAGRYSIDSETGQVGPEIAALLGIAYLPGIRRLALDRCTDGRVRLLGECEGDDGFVEVESGPPVLVTCTDRWKTRIPRVMPDDDAAARAEIATWSVGDLRGSTAGYGEPGSPTWVATIEAVESTRARRIIDATVDPVAAADAILEAIDGARARGASRRSTRQILHSPRANDLSGVWVIGERMHDGSLRPVVAELLGAADDLAHSLGCGVACLLLEPWRPDGDHVDDEPVRESEGARLSLDLGRLGADALLWNAREQRGPDAQVEQLIAAITQHAPRIVLAPATVLGRDLVPRVAARLSLGLTGDAIGVDLDGEGHLRALKPAFGGQIVAAVLSRTRPEMATLRPGVCEPLVPDEARGAAKILPFSGKDTPPERVRCTRFEGEVSLQGAALEEARAVIGIGYGLGGADRVPEVEALARDLSAAVGATRRVCDLGWVPRQLQIGLSGRSIAPDVYLALGVRGSFNHTVGLRRAGTIIAVNHDREAEVFASADLGIVGDAPMLVATLRERVARRSSRA